MRDRHRREGFAFSLDDTLHIAWEDEKIAVGSLKGFTRTSVLVLPLPMPSEPFRRRPQVLSIPAGTIVSLWAVGGTSLNGVMLVRRAETSAWVPLEEIARIYEIRYSYQWFHTGAIADAAGLAAAFLFFAVKDH